MSVRAEPKTVSEEITVYHCDHCDVRIGEAPIADRAGYFLACSVAPKDSGPLWMATLCGVCMEELAQWADGSKP